MELTKWMNLAAKYGQDGLDRGDGGPFGSVIVRNGHVIGKGWNQCFLLSDPTAHAEIQAIRDACKQLQTLELVGGVMYATAEPCPMCLSAIYWAQLDAVYFACSKEISANAGFNDRKIYQQLELPWNARSLNMVQMPNEAATHLMQSWIEKMQGKQHEPTNSGPDHPECA